MDNKGNAVTMSSEFKLQNSLIIWAGPEIKLQNGLDIWSQNYVIRILGIEFYINLGSSTILKILSLTLHEHGIFFTYLGGL